MMVFYATIPFEDAGSPKGRHRLKSSEDRFRKSNCTATVMHVGYSRERTS